MDDQVLALLQDRFDKIDRDSRDRFDKVDRDNKSQTEMLKNHTEKDEAYWKKIDAQQAQVRLAKYLAGGGAGAVAFNWLYQLFKH